MEININVSHLSSLNRLSTLWSSKYWLPINLLKKWKLTKIEFSKPIKGSPLTILLKGKRGDETLYSLRLKKEETNV